MAKRRIPGLSPDPKTNVMVADIVIRGAGKLARHFAKRALLRPGQGKEGPEKAVEGLSVTQSLATVAIARLATRSVPGAVIVGTGIIAKAVFDRSHEKRKAMIEGRKAELEKMACARQQADEE